MKDARGELDLLAVKADKGLTGPRLASNNRLLKALLEAVGWPASAVIV